MNSIFYAEKSFQWNESQTFPSFFAKPEVMDEDEDVGWEKAEQKHGNLALGKSGAITLQTENFSFISKGLTSGYS